MITKTQILNSLGQLPENLTIDQLMEHLIFIQQEEKGLDNSSNGDIHSKEEAKNKLRPWLKYFLD